MKEMSFEKMEEIQGGISWQCALASTGLILTLAAISATATPAAGVALALEASAYLATVGGWAASCAEELGII